MSGIGLHQSLKGVGVVAFLGAALGMSQGALAQTPSLTARSLSPDFSAMAQLKSLVSQGKGKIGVLLTETTTSARYASFYEPRGDRRNPDHYRAPSGNPVYDTYEGGIGHPAARRHGRHHDYRDERNDTYRASFGDRVDGYPAARRHGRHR